jgi:hypothetical protein
MRRALPIAVVVLVLLLSVTGAVSADSRTYVAHLSGGEEVPPADTVSQGQAIFRLSKDGTELEYKLIVANLEDLRVSHIHLAPAGSNGGVVVFLYGVQLIPGRFSGVLAEGTISAANFTGTLAGQPMSTLISHFESGNAYVNVHTVDYPGGEIRGQIR